jgi:hypothetical protein
MKRKYIFCFLPILLLSYACKEKSITKEEKLQDEDLVKYFDTAKFSRVYANKDTLTIRFRDRASLYAEPRERLDSCLATWTRTGDTLLVLLADHHCLFQYIGHKYSDIVGEWSIRGDTLIIPGVPGPDGKFHTVTFFHENVDPVLKEYCRTGALLFIREPHWLIMYTDSVKIHL